MRHSGMERYEWYETGINRYGKVMHSIIQHMQQCIVPPDNTIMPPPLVITACS